MADSTPSSAGAVIPRQPSSQMDAAQLHGSQMHNPDLLLPQIPNPIPSYPTPQVALPHAYLSTQQYSHLPGYSVNPISPASAAPPGMAPPSGSVPTMQYQAPYPGQPPNPTLISPFSSVPNGYAPPGTQVAAVSPGIVRFPSPYPAMVRPPVYHLRPPGVLPVGTRTLVPGLPGVPGVPGVRPIVPVLVRPSIHFILPGEKPQTTVYVGKISPSVEDDFMLSLLQLCGSVRSWKRGRDPSGAPRGFGFCEFEYAEGVLRCLRLLNRYNVDGQELLINVNQATKEYLEKYVEKKAETVPNFKKEESHSDVKDEVVKPCGETSQNEVEKEKETVDFSNFGIVSDEDRESDLSTLAKLVNMVEERIKNKKLPPPPPLQSSGTEEDAGNEKRDNDSNEHAASPDLNQRINRRSRDRDRGGKRDQERDVERYEREAERERVRKEREMRRKIEDADRAFEERVKDWEYREREKDKQRQYEKEREKEKERKRRKEILYDEEDEDDDRKRWRRSVVEERKRKRAIEKKEDMADVLKEQEEIEEAKQRAEFEKLNPSVDEKKSYSEEEAVVEQDIVKDDDMAIASVSESEIRKKLGFGLVGSGRRTAVLSVFHEEDEEETQQEKKMRPLVPIDYSTEELQAVQPVSLEISKRGSKEDRNRRSSKVITPEKQRLLDAKQLIDTIPKTKDELFSYQINWSVYDKHKLHERMKPWISKKITEFLGEEEATLVDYIVSGTQDHVQASQMLEMLQTILDDEAEMFVLKMWRMLIFEIKKVETGLTVKPKQ